MLELRLNPVCLLYLLSPISYIESLKPICPIQSAQEGVLGGKRVDGASESTGILVLGPICLCQSLIVYLEIVLPISIEGND